MPKLDLESLKIAAAAGNLNKAIEEMLSRCAPDDPPLMSDLIVREGDGGMFVKQALEHRFKNDRETGRPMDQRFQWKLLVRYDKWGNVPNPGEKVVKKQQKSLYYEPGKIANTLMLEDDMRAGEYEKKWIDKIEYVIDEKGCITCEYHDAVYFLQTFGIHGKSGRPISLFHKRESTKDYERYEARGPFSKQPVNADDGQKLHVWYWRYQEMDKEDYAKLPKREKTDKPKRGVANAAV